MNNNKFTLLQEIQDNYSPPEADNSIFEGWRFGEELIMRIAEQDEDIPSPLEGKYGEYTISFSRFDQFDEGLSKVNKLAHKLGVPILRIESKTKVIIGKDKDTGAPKFGWKIKLQGEPVRLNGWEFLASLEHGPNGNNIRYVPGKEDIRVKQYANASNSCDFCNSARDRNNTYIVRNIETGELKQVGGQCLQKYIGDDARKLAKFAFHMDEFVGGLTMDDSDDDDGEPRGKRGIIATDAQTALAAAIIAIDMRGFIRSSSDDDSRVPTVRYVSCALFDQCGDAFYNNNQDVIDAIRDMDGAAKKRADDIIAWFEALPDNAKESSYMVSLESTLHSDMVTPRSLGLVVSLPAVYFRAHNTATQTANKPVSQWQGTVGAKIPETEVTVVHVGFHDTAYGVTQLVKMIDKAGNAYTWWNSSKNEYEKDQQLKIIGVVKKHEEYRGDKITVLTRVKSK